MPSFTVLTLNLHKGFSAFNRRFVLPELRDAVHQISADIVFLQEVLGSHAGHAGRHANWPEVPQYEFLADTIWKDFAYGRNAVYPEGDHGNALLSRFPILRHENRDASIAGTEQRGLLHCVLEVPHGSLEIHSVCVHLGLREAHRREQIEALCDMVDREIPRDAPLIIAGDFNDWRQRGHRRVMRCAGVREAFVERRGGCARTFPARLPLLRLDRIYVRNVQVMGTAVLSSSPWSKLSDHAGLAVDLTLSTETG